MKLPALGVEYVCFTATADFTLDGTIEVFISTNSAFPTNDAVWSPASWMTDEVVTGTNHVRTFETLLAGSAVTTVPAGATQLDIGYNYCFTRLTDNPEIIIRSAGRLEAS